MANDDEDEGPNARAALIVAAIAAVVIRALVPFGGTILYPFTLFATWVHEMGHGVTALLAGGSFESLDIYANASGLAHVSAPHAWQQALFAAGGLLAPPLAGASILAFARGPKRARIALGALALVMALSVVVWVRSITGLIAVPLVAALMAWVALRGGPSLRTIGAQFLGVLLGLDTISRIDYLFTGSATIGGVERPSDVAIIAHAIGGHHLLWGSLLAVISLALLAAGVRLAWAEPLRLPWRRRTESPITTRRARRADQPTK